MIKIRRLKTLGIALGLSVVAAAVGVSFYSLPRQTLPEANRIADYVYLNEALFWARDQSWLAWAHFPDTDERNDRLKLIAIDEPAMLPPPRGEGQFPWPRSVHGHILERLAKAGAKIVTYDIVFLEPAQDPTQDVAFAKGLAAQPTILGFTLATSTGGILNVEEPPPVLKSHVNALGFTTVDTPGGWLVGQYFTIQAGNQTYRSLAGETVETFTGKKITPIDDWHAKFGDETLPLDGNGQFTMLPFKVVSTMDSTTGGAVASRQGGEHVNVAFIEYLSFADVNAMDDATLKAFTGGNIVVIGPTSQ